MSSVVIVLFIILFILIYALVVHPGRLTPQNSFYDDVPVSFSRSQSTIVLSKSSTSIPQHSVAWMKSDPNSSTIRRQAFMWQYHVSLFLRWKHAGRNDEYLCFIQVVHINSTTFGRVKSAVDTSTIRRSPGGIIVSKTETCVTQWINDEYLCFVQFVDFDSTTFGRVKSVVGTSTIHAFMWRYHCFYGGNMCDTIINKCTVWPRYNANSVITWTIDQAPEMFAAWGQICCYIYEYLNVSIPSDDKTCLPII